MGNMNDVRKILNDAADKADKKTAKRLGFKSIEKFRKAREKEIAKYCGFDSVEEFRKANHIIQQKFEENGDEIFKKLMEEYSVGIFHK